MSGVIEDKIIETLQGEARVNALELVAFLKSKGVRFDKGEGYWHDKLYWSAGFQGECVCFILINGYETGHWVVWSDDSQSDGFRNVCLNDRTRHIAWKNVDICGNCGGCDKPGGSPKILFGKLFQNVCVTAMRFNDPDAPTVACIKILAEKRIEFISQKPYG